MKKTLLTLIILTATLMASAQRYVDNIKFKTQALDYSSTYEIGFKRANIKGFTVPTTVNIGTIKDDQWVSQYTFSIQAAYIWGAATAEIKKDGSVILSELLYAGIAGGTSVKSLYSDTKGSMLVGVILGVDNIKIYRISF